MSASHALMRDLCLYVAPQAIRLSQVVRSSQRIMAGARQFAVSNIQATSSHAAKGPPLKTFIFPTPRGDASPEEALVAAYAEHTKQAVNAVRRQFPGLSLDGRLAIVVPDEIFMEKHREAFEGILNERQSPGVVVQLVSAVDSSAMIPGIGGHESDNKERICYAPIQEMDGLERLIVVSVGFDRASSSSEDDATRNEVRSRLYRAITRAQMMFLIVNEGIPGGWLEFMGHIKVSPVRRSVSWSPVTFFFLHNLYSHKSFSHTLR